jgi:DNA-binding transcriptional LysR family regulator
MSITHPNLIAQVEALYWIVRLGGFHAASRHMNLTQPTISARIRELEAALGEQLFHRGASQAALTPAGQRAYSYAERMLKLVSALRHRDDPYGGLHGVLHIGAVESVAFAFLPQLMAQVQQELPQLEHAVTVDVSRNLANMLGSQTLDIAILSDPKAESMLESVLLGQTDVQWICKSGLVARDRPLNASGFGEIPILSHPRESRLFETTREWFRVQNVWPRILVCNSLMLMSHFVRRGFGAALLPISMVQEGLESGRLMVIEVDPPIPAIPMYVSYNRNRDGPAMQTVVRILEAEARSSTLFVEEGRRLRSNVKSGRFDAPGADEATSAPGTENAFGAEFPEVQPILGGVRQPVAPGRKPPPRRNQPRS